MVRVLFAKQSTGVTAGAGSIPATSFKKPVRGYPGDKHNDVCMQSLTPQDFSPEGR